ncbi:MAG: type II toxin-antitoxin system VapC family toxin [Acidobacteria bacterium]|nr:type II toxin-antitoxin system VapC family toxin [Acidobacteriota bacterium]
MRILLDTNAYAALMRGHEGIASRVRRAEQVVLSAIVVGELMFGFRSGARCKKNIEEMEAFLDNPYVVFASVSLTTADRFGRIAASLRRKGRPIPTNDIWIAAHALETGADMISFDRHFDAIEGLVRIAP